MATRNAHKTREIQRILGVDFAVQDLSAHPETSETVESGKTFEENAVLKATAASRQLPGLVVADDSGLEVDALGGAPGIYSARYAAPNATDKQNIDKLLSELARIERAKRSARFRCVIALAQRGQIARHVRRSCRRSDRRFSARHERLWLRSSIHAKRIRQNLRPTFFYRKRSSEPSRSRSGKVARAACES